jgi:DNA-binding MarR family transcriptional regulator
MPEPEFELLISREGLFTEKAVHDLAEWYASGDTDVETFEAHLMMLRAHATLLGSAQRGRRTPLSMERFGLLRVLYRAPEARMLLSDVSRALNVSPTSISKLMSSMSAQKLVERIDDPGDKRRAWAKITDAGKQLVEDSMPRVRQSTRDRWRGLTPDEKRMLVHLLTKFTMHTDAGPAGPKLRRLEGLSGPAGEEDLASARDTPAT